MMEKHYTGDTSYDDDGEPVPAVGFDYPGDPEPEVDERQETLRLLLEWLASGDDKPEIVGRRAIALAYLMRVMPRGQRALAKRMGLSVGRVNAILREIASESGLSRLTG